MAVIAACSWLFAAPAEARDLPSPGDQEVVVLFSDETLLPAMTVYLDALRQQLAEATQGRASVSTQFLDSTRFAGEAHDEEFARWLTGRYAGRRVPVLVCVSLGASTFAARFGASIWPGATILFHGVDKKWLEETTRPTRSVVIALALPYRETLETALTLLPDTRHVVLLRGATETDIQWLRDARSDIAPLGSRIGVSEIGGVSLGEAKRRIASLPAGSLILPTMFSGDADGRAFVPRDAIAQLAAVANRPMLGLHDSWMGVGITGGLMLNYERVGRSAGRIVSRILDGEDVVRESPLRITEFDWKFDSRQIVRWGIDERKLPAGSLVLYREPSAWQRYRWQLTAIGGVLFLMTGLLAGLIVERGRKQRAEAQVQRQLRELSQLNATAAMGGVAATLAHELNQPLTAMLSNAQALRRLVMKGNLDHENAAEILDDIIEQDKRAGEVIQGIRKIVRKDRHGATAVDLNGVVRDTITLMRVEATRAGATIVTDLASELPPLHGDRVQLQQMVFNLMLNAVQATMVAGNGSRQVSIATRREGQRMELRIRDSGPGISVDAIGQIFEAFFTTKLDGLGIGLSISRTIVELHGGRIAASNHRDGGAEFSVTFPVETVST